MTTTTNLQSAAAQAVQAWREHLTAVELNQASADADGMAIGTPNRRWLPVNPRAYRRLALAMGNLRRATDVN